MASRCASTTGPSFCLSRPSPPPPPRVTAPRPKGGGAVAGGRMATRGCPSWQRRCGGVAVRDMDGALSRAPEPWRRRWLGRLSSDWLTHPGCIRANPRDHHRRRLAESWLVGNGTRQQAVGGGGRTLRSLVTAPRRTLAASSRGCWCPKGRRAGKVPTERLRPAVRPARRASLHPSARREVVTLRERRGRRTAANGFATQADLIVC